MELKRSTNSFSNYSAFFRALVILYIFLIGGLIALRILFNHNNDAFKRGFALVSHTRTVIESTDSMYLLSQNLVWNSRNYLLNSDSVAYFNSTIRDSLQAKANHLLQLVKVDSSPNDIVQNLQQKIIELIDLSGNYITAPDSKDEKSGAELTTLNNTISQKIQLIKAEEFRLLASRRMSLIKTVDTTRTIFVLSNFLMLIILVGSFLLIFYHFRKRQKTENKLSESENRFRTLINSIKDLAIFMVDKEGRVVNWYEGAHKIKGYTSEEIIGKPISVFYTPKAAANGEPERHLQLAAEQGSVEVQGWRVRKDGSSFWADVLITAVRNKNGELLGFTKVTRDFTLHKKVEDESQKALEKERELNEIKSNFVSMASHEFRTPLSTILSSVSLMEFYKTTETQDKRDKHISRINSAVNEMVATLEEFLSLEKIEEGKAQVKHELFNIRHLAENIRSKFSTDLKTGQVIEYCHTGNEDIYIDQGYLNHILTNLLSNAIKYSPANSVIYFTTSVETSRIILIVKDNGIGISDEDQKHLFERFFRASNTSGIKGTGLGLHIVKRYVELLGGTISVNSTIGKGTEFTVII